MQWWRQSSDAAKSPMKSFWPFHGQHLLPPGVRAFHRECHLNTRGDEQQSGFTGGFLISAEEERALRWELDHDLPKKKHQWPLIRSLASYLESFKAFLYEQRKQRWTDPDDVPLQAGSWWPTQFLGDVGNQLIYLSSDAWKLAPRIPAGLEIWERFRDTNLIALPSLCAPPHPLEVSLLSRERTTQHLWRSDPTGMAGLVPQYALYRWNGDFLPGLHKFNIHIETEIVNNTPELWHIHELWLHGMKVLSQALVPMAPAAARPVPVRAAVAAPEPAAEILTETDSPSTSVSEIWTDVRGFDLLTFEAQQAVVAWCRVILDGAAPLVQFSGHLKAYLRELQLHSAWRQMQYECFYRRVAVAEPRVPNVRVQLAGPEPSWTNTGRTKLILRDI